jgi:hypothetical protein
MPVLGDGDNYTAIHRHITSAFQVFMAINILVMYFIIVFCQYCHIWLNRSRVSLYLCFSQLHWVVFDSIRLLEIVRLRNIDEELTRKDSKTLSCLISSFHSRFKILKATSVLLLLSKVAEVHCARMLICDIIV